MEISTVFTIGHSNQPAAEFLSLLKANGVELVVDVRSKPYSRYRHFKREALEERLAGLGIRYSYRGEELGGHPPGDEFYNEQGRVAYERLAGLRKFRRAIGKIVDDSEREVLALLCAEEDPAKCHRHPLLAVALLESGLRVIHLRRDGSVQDAEDMIGEGSQQLPLLEPVGEDAMWQSPKRIRPRGHA